KRLAALEGQRGCECFRAGISINENDIVLEILDPQFTSNGFGVAETPWMDMDGTHACARICSLSTIELRIPSWQHKQALQLARLLVQPVTRFLSSTVIHLIHLHLPG